MIRNLLRVLFFLQRAAPALVEFRLFVIGQRLGVDEMPSRLGAVELTTTGQFVVVVRHQPLRDGHAGGLLSFELVLDLINVLVAIAKPYGALVLLVLGPGALFLGLLTRPHGDFCSLAVLGVFSAWLREDVTMLLVRASTSSTLLVAVSE